MATVYKIEIQTVSSWINYPPEEIAKDLKEFLESRDHLGMVNTKIKVIRE
jgi:hypothetical protein